MSNINRTDSQLFIIIFHICFFIFIPHAHAQSINFTLDFEEGNLRGWTKTGNAFDHQPTLGDNPTARHRGQPSNHQGRYWIGTYEKYQGKHGQKPGDIQGDRQTGTLTSSPFKIPSGTLSFLIGGGSSFETRVELLIQYPVEGNVRVFYATGQNTETMHGVTWELAQYTGKTGQIRIVDASSGGWGHINADDFRFDTAAGTETASLHLRLESSSPFQVGRPIRFSVRTEPEYPGLQYQFRFGDGSISNWVTENSAEHIYSREGTYQVVAVARATQERPMLTRAPVAFTVTSNTVSFEVKAQPSQIELSLRSDRDRIRAGQSVRFTAVIRPEYQNAEYKFDFGDGMQSEWMHMPEVTHFYNTEGIFQASARARLGVERLVTSEPLSIEVIPSSAEYRATIEADRTMIVQNERVRFIALLTPAVQDAEYMFNFGDGTRSGWTAGHETEHTYITAGRYQVFVAVRSAARIITESRAVQVEVTPIEIAPVRHNVFLEADKHRAAIDEVVIFRGYIHPPLGNVRYQFNFGDGASSEWLSEPVTSHAYNNTGTYNPYLTAKIGEELFRSDEIALAVIDFKLPYEGEQNGGTDTLFFPLWIKRVAIIIGLLIAFGGGCYLFSRIKRTKKIDKHLMPTIQIRPKKDIGTQLIESETPIKSDFEVSLRPVLDQGEQEIETGGSLIIGERMENE